MRDNLKNTVIKSFGSILKGVSDLLKMSTALTILLIMFLVWPALCFWILYVNMPGFGFLAYVGGLFIFTGLSSIMAIIVTTFQNWFFRIINDWGVKSNKKTYSTPSLKYFTFIFTIVFLLVIAGALLMILEILIKSS